ncbi:hypothetical protein BC939DRAFT_504116 [Gamsiella multidivaricata]|uniref:uncharacterized protein n=1 Tax=Gamsiella multidivaricata TaxID=101098 RepID=UPI00221FB63C|nr:uncharacterized protein BC939DRAFT_504116 [Gamsiella multidivaricata]KAG0364121.1 hypothetical protein BGZ54_007824 [Gamsiella multidivaricata]KAI7821860.1 hypothetical protein BC939DRAFT_504116 [Gamsiella multidivaricata]
MSFASFNPLSIRKPQHESPAGSTDKDTTTSNNNNNNKQPLDDKRIYVGNLDPAIDEYIVLKLFSPFGKITKLDFMFHWHGPKKGTPRGYCFLEFESAAQAAAAIKEMNRKAIKLRPLSVSLANMAPPSADSEKGRKRMLDPNRPTAFSLLKAGGALKNASTNEKIKAMERKLAQMAEPPKASAPPAHSSLPPKPAVTMSTSSRPHRDAGVGTTSASLTNKRHRPY